MADTSGMQDIRGIDIDKLAKGFGEEQNQFKNFVANATTSAREIRWYQKGSTILDTTTTTGVTGTGIMSVGSRALPQVAEQNWTRQTSYVKKFFIESPTISMEDIKDSDIDILATNVRDLVKAVARKVDLRIYSVITEAAAATPTTPNPATVNFAAATADGWDVSATADPVKDILLGLQKIRVAGYDASSCILLMNPIEYRYLLEYIINVKGSSVPSFASDKIQSGVLMNFLGCSVVVSQNATTDYVIMWVPSVAATWKSFMPITSVVIDEPGIGKKIRVWEEGEAILVNPLAVNVITDVSNA